MIPAEMVLGFFTSARSYGKKIKITSTEKGVKKGVIQDVNMEDRVITVVVEGEKFVIDMNVCEAKTSFFDRRVLHISGEEQFKIQLI